ncbi:hypothetical protein QTJ16_003717 [Diplocarpon rosae]|uniref:HPP transmembrane region domain-containing protein n=1 Tax=Diplocarpon rosae TaxID=946125 RepID=A0AAD9T0R0_9HELO|nr:hypothetical protein QTJ16_003717 [Diplocarpon rosae]
MSAFNFDIDRYINPFVPRPRLYLLPKPISWFLGHREKPTAPVGDVIVWFWAFIGALAGILAVEAVFRTDRLRSDGAPTVIASLGAAAILEYNTIESPLAQPRNVLLGQVFSSIIGVGVTKLFSISSDFDDLRWIAGALSVALASAFMSFTKTVHPPAGATALLASTSPEIEKIGWFLVPLIILGSTLMLAVACVLNNVQRQFPMYWWTPVDLDRSKNEDVELGVRGEASRFDDYVEGNEGRIVIDGERIVVPSCMALELEEKAMLEILREKLREGVALEVSTTRDTDRTHVKDVL